jgi:hypothetical protein
MVSRALFGPAPFVEAPAIGEFLRSRVPPDQPIFVYGSEPEICFFAQRRSASSFVYLYPLFERHARADELQFQLIDEVERARPDYVATIEVDPVCHELAPQDAPLLRWLPGYLSAFEPCGWTRVISESQTEYAFEGPEARQPTPDSQVIIWKRKR